MIPDGTCFKGGTPADDNWYNLWIQAKDGDPYAGPYFPGDLPRERRSGQSLGRGKRRLNGFQRLFPLLDQGRLHLAVEGVLMGLLKIQLHYSNPRKR